MTLSATIGPGACRSARIRKSRSLRFVRSAAGGCLRQSPRALLSRSRKLIFESRPGPTTYRANPGLSFELTMCRLPRSCRGRPQESTTHAERRVGQGGFGRPIVRETSGWPRRWQPSFRAEPGSLGRRWFRPRTKSTPPGGENLSPSRPAGSDSSVSLDHAMTRASLPRRVGESRLGSGEPGGICIAGGLTPALLENTPPSARGEARPRDDPVLN